MTLKPHADLHLQKLTIGEEREPLLVIDNFVDKPEELAALAAGKLFGDIVDYYPGIRAKVPLTYQQFFVDQLRPLLLEYFAMPGPALRFTACHFSLVTTPAEKLKHLQRIPHIDSAEKTELAFIHYLFTGKHGGTAFYRHRRTGFEFVDRTRKQDYFRIVAEERDGPDAPPAGYISGDTPLYQRIGAQEGVFNRVLIYRRTSLHSADLGPGFRPDPDPRTGRLSINGFLT